MIPLINKIETEQQLAQARKVAGQLLKEDTIDGVAWCREKQVESNCGGTGTGGGSDSGGGGIEPDARQRQACCRGAIRHWYGTR